MNKIAICDNDLRMKNQIKRICEVYDEKEGISNKYYEFRSGEELLTSPLHFDLIFLDIEMDDLNGIETAEQIRKTDTEVILIIISGYSKYKTRAYGLHVFDYIDKPFTPSQIMHALQEVKRYRRPITSEFTFFRTTEGMTKFNVKEILYLEYNNRKTLIHTTCGIYVTTDTLSECMNRLKNSDFFSPHRAFIVNFYHIRTFESSLIILDDRESTTLPISKLKIKVFRNAFSMYLGREISHV
ncbi:LytTR family DNA-binding domain-containing protein [[Clostridium] innocuum]|nr:LytTR family DNA-binding domain-containing protein [[Clostridium] innocuum]MCR0577485.1 LytTR family DNA-binding domain-containing protein [[Clostridium] innocuum]